jgi:hypothetical protein
MHGIPHAVLSERFQERMRGRRLRSAVFLTFRFEPDFFEQEVLPAVLDLPLSHVPTVRLLQLEDALQHSVDHVAVYYDRGGLMAGTQSAKLDVRRIPTAHATGYFHPKNVLLLTEAAEPDESGHRPRHLLVATMSANLTRAGWWENVEVCHIEDVGEGGTCGFRDDLLDLIKRVKVASRTEEDHEALDAIWSFVRGLEQRQQRTANGVLHPRLYSGGQSVVDFLDDVRGDQLRGLCLEVISPYFDKADAAPLRALCERLAPREVRVLLPRADDGSALCGDSLYDSVREIEGAHWAELPVDRVRAGKGEHVKRRTVHAKVYRFFHPRQRYEAFFVGSVNLTTAAHSKGGNFESAFLVETTPTRVPDWWLEVDTKKPSRFLAAETDESTTATTSLSIRFSWPRTTAEAFWDATTASGALAVSAQGVPLFQLDALPLREWTRLPKEVAYALARILPSTSFLGVSEAGSQAGGAEATILVQEDGMAHKPSILLSLTAADILRYWALLTPEQRAAFLDERVGLMPEALVQLGLEAAPLARTDASLFDTFAGIYHAFGALERFVLEALGAGRMKEAEYRLLGKKYDSLPSLLDRVLRAEDGQDQVTRYVIALCAKQLVRRVESQHPEFRERHRQSFQSLRRRVAAAERIRDQFSFGTREDRSAFLDWFDRWFLTRTEPAEATT